MKQQLEEYIDLALTRRLNAQNKSSSEELIGECYYNTKVLTEVLDEHGIEYIVYHGALLGDFPPNEEPDTFEEAKAMGFVHYWVECEGYTCEISSESEQYYGDSIVLQNRPSNYIVFPDSRKESLN